MFHQNCPLCATESCPGLPETLTLTFSGLEDAVDSGPLLSGMVGSVTFHPTAPITNSTGAISGFKVLNAGAGLARFARLAPELRAVNQTGFDATFSVTVRQITVFGVEYWEIDQATVVSGGHGYVHDSQMLFLVADGDVCTGAPNAVLKVARGAPGLVVRLVPPNPCSCSTPNAVDGTGARLQVNIAQSSSVSGSELWAVSGVTVLDGGHGYTNGQSLEFLLGPSDVALSSAAATITVSAGGVISAVSVQSGGAYYKAGVASSISVIGRGRFYREDKTAPAVVDDLTALPASTQNLTPNLLALDGATPASPDDRATFDVSVDVDKDSPTFGDSLSISLVSGGSGYRAGKSKATCLALLNGQSIVVKAQSAENAVYACLQSKYGSLLRPFVAPDGYDSKETGLTTAPFSTNDFAFAYRGRIEPTVNVSSYFGNTLGATWSVEWEPISLGNGLPAYGVASVEATGGSLLFDSTALFAAPSTAADKVAIQAEMTVYKHRLAPLLSVSTPCHQGNATFAIEYVLLESVPPVYGIAKVKVLSGGSGYSGVVPLSFSAVGSTVQDAEACAIAFADADGQLESVQVRSAGRFWQTENRPGVVAISNPGAYYRESNTAQPIYDPDATIEIIQHTPSNGSGAAVAFTVDLDPASSTFGKLSSVSMASSGSGYVLRSAIQAYRGTCNILSPLPITCEVDIGSNCALEVSVRARGDVAQVMPLLGSADAYVFFADELGSQQTLTLENQQITLPAFLPTNAGTCVIDWGGVFDEGQQVCSCCDVTTEYCGPPPESGWPLGEGESSNAFVDVFGVVFIRSCNGVNANGDNVSPNGGWIEWKAVYDENDNFVEWQRLCGECDEAIWVGVDPNTFEDIYSVFPEPTSSHATRGSRGVTQCVCSRFDESKRCVFGPELAEDGCWTGGYVVETFSCDNPLP